MRTRMFLRRAAATVVLIALTGPPVVYASAPNAASLASGTQCTALQDRLAAAEQALTNREPVLDERLDAIATALNELEEQRDTVSASESAERKEALITEQSALQNEHKFLESAKTAWQAAIDACESAARFREELEHFRAARQRDEVEFVPGDVAALQAQLEPLESACAALKEYDAVCAQRLADLAEQLEQAEDQPKRLLETEQASLLAEKDAVRHKLAARAAERALLEAKLSAAREIVGQAPASQPTTATTVPSADESDALNKQQLAEQLDAEARDGLAFAQSRLQNLERALERASAQEVDGTRLENERKYWKRREGYEQRRLQQAELVKLAAQQKKAVGELGKRIDEARKTLDQLRRQRLEMTPEERRKHADDYRKKAEDARKEADGLDERAKVEEKEIEPLQQLLPSLDAIQQALAERLEQAKDASYAEFEATSAHVRKIRRQLDVERQQIDLLLVTRENIVYGKMRQATLTRELAELYVQCADVLVPPVPSFWERQRKILDSVAIVAAALVITYVIRLVIWLIRHVLAYLNTLLGRARFSIKRVGTLLAFAGSIVKLFVWVFAVVLILNEFGIDPAKSTGALGLIGLIMAGMFQQIVVDFVKGLDIVAGRHYNVGDFIEVDGKHGHVVDFNVKHTRLRTVSGHEFNIPNSRCVPSRRFPDGYVDNYVDITLESSADEGRARTALGDVCADLNQRLEPVRDEPEFVRQFARPHGRVTLRYRVRVLPGCPWVVTDYFIPTAKDALAKEGIKLAADPTFCFINRIETFRKLFSRRLTEEQIVRDL